MVVMIGDEDAGDGGLDAENEGDDDDAGDDPDVDEDEGGGGGGDEGGDRRPLLTFSFGEPQWTSPQEMGADGHLSLPQPNPV